MNNWLARLGCKLGCGWLRTLRVHWVGPMPESGGVFLLWHEQLPACIRAFAHRGIHVLISSSADGGVAAQACDRFGYQVHRGSSSRGGAAGLRKVARALRGKPQDQELDNIEIRKGAFAGMALDGPRGPRRSLKPGSLWLAQSTRLPVIPIWIQARQASRLNSWDRCQVPWPFSRIEVRLGKAFHPQSLEEIEFAMKTLESAAQARR